MPGSRFAFAVLALGISVTLSAQPVPQASRTTPHSGTHLSANSVLTWDSGTFQYDGSGNIKAVGTNVYVYDTAGRLVSGTAAGPANREVYAYDAAGNRLSAVLTPGSTPCTPNIACSEAISVDPATNHLTGTGIQYDDAGDLVAKDGTAYVYDAAKMLTRRDDASAVYVYTADDERLATIVGGGSWKWTVRNLDGKVLREFTGSDASSVQWSRDYVYRGSQLLATQTISGVSRFHLDQLGTPRLITDANNTRVGQHDYYPFGTELSSSLNEPSAISMKFTGHERDVSVNGSNLDYMHARYYSSGQGRFITVDPTWDSADISTPQTWNRYAYVENKPINAIDADGRCPNCIAAAIGAGVGAVIGGGVEWGSQVLAGETVNWNRVGGAMLGGAITGAISGLTLGANLAVSAGAGAVANVVAGGAERAVDGDKVYDTSAMSKDLALGAVGGAAGSWAGGKAAASVENSAAHKVEVRIAESRVRAAAGRSAQRQVSKKAALTAVTRKPLLARIVANVVVTSVQGTATKVEQDVKKSTDEH
ncbi:MAG: hypothetical protein JWO97_893 [Acidobacteria bacterium]|nr:hypothetical protein [Acidobacteriota bacterium]